MSSTMVSCHRVESISVAQLSMDLGYPNFYITRITVVDATGETLNIDLYSDKKVEIKDGNKQ